jgi:hypothetical protein
MGLPDRLRRLDSRVFKSMRQPREPAEDFLRRVAVRRWPGGRSMPLEVQQALRELFDQRDST